MPPARNVPPASFLDTINDGSALPEAPQPAGLACSLFRFQRQALRFMVRQSLNLARFFYTPLLLTCA